MTDDWAKKTRETYQRDRSIPTLTPNSGKEICVCVCSGVTMRGLFVITPQQNRCVCVRSHQ